MLRSLPLSTLECRPFRRLGQALFFTIYTSFGCRVPYGCAFFRPASNQAQQFGRHKWVVKARPQVSIPMHNHWLSPNYSRTLESMMIVTGPSLTRSTCMAAPNSPVSMGLPKSCVSLRMNC